MWTCALNEWVYEFRFRSTVKINISAQILMDLFSTKTELHYVWCLPEMWFRVLFCHAIKACSIKITCQSQLSGAIDQFVKFQKIVGVQTGDIPNMQYENRIVAILINTNVYFNFIQFIIHNPRPLSLLPHGVTSLSTSPRC